MTSRSLCSQCQRPARACICRWITPIDNRVELLILQHPLEVHNPKNTAGLLNLSLRQSQRYIGEVFAVEWLNESLHCDDKINLLLYPPSPDPQATGIATPPPMPVLNPAEASRLRLIVIDATWRKSRKMLYLNPPLQHLPRFHLTGVPVSAYQIRKAHHQDQLSTLEASCYALQQLDADRVDRQVNYQPLLQAFAGFIAQQLAFIPVPSPTRSL